MFFWKIDLIADKSLLRRWTLKWSQVIFDKEKLVMSWFYLGFGFLISFSLKTWFTTLMIGWNLLYKKKKLLTIEEGDEDAQNNKEDP